MFLLYTTIEYTICCNNLRKYFFQDCQVHSQHPSKLLFSLLLVGPFDFINGYIRMPISCVFISLPFQTQCVLYQFSTPVSCADSPFQGHTDFRSRFSRASPLLQLSSKVSLTRMTRRCCAIASLKLIFF